MPRKKMGLFVYSDGFRFKSVDETVEKKAKETARAKNRRPLSLKYKHAMTSRESRISVCCPLCGSENIIRSGKTQKGIQRYRCSDCGKRFVLTGKKNLSHARLSVSEILLLVKCIYLGLSIESTAFITGVSEKTVILWQQRAFAIATEWVNGTALKGKVWIDEVYFNLTEETGVTSEPKRAKKAGLSFMTACVCIGCDAYGDMFCRVVKAGKCDSLSIFCCFKGRIEKDAYVVHDDDKSHKAFFRNSGIRNEVVRSKPKTEESLRKMKPINDYSALLVNEMRKHAGTKTSHLDERLCFISFKAHLRREYGEIGGYEILVSKMVKAQKTVLFRKKREKSAKGKK